MRDYVVEAAIIDRLKVLLAERDMHPHELADRLGVSRRNMRNRINGRARIEAVDVYRFAEFFGISPAALFPPNGIPSPGREFPNPPRR